MKYMENIEIVPLEPAKFTKEEQEIIKNIGIHNDDYCILAVLNKRFPNLEIKYDERSEIIYILDNQICELNKVRNIVKNLEKYHAVNGLAEMIEILCELIKNTIRKNKELQK